MTEYNQKPQTITAFHDFPALESGAVLAGYAALIAHYELLVPSPDTLCTIGATHRRREAEGWRFFTPRHTPDDTLQGHLTFALKYEGVDLTILSALFKRIVSDEIEAIVRAEPTGAYSRRIWFLYEWLNDTEIAVEDATQGNFTLLVNDKLQYPGPARDSRRHRVRNNLPGTKQFCPMVRRTPQLDEWIAQDLSQVALDHVGKTHADLLSRAAAFLLLKDSKASYTIEGESPPHNRVERWGKTIGEAGRRALSVEELEHLQSLVIEDTRFIVPGVRVAGGFVGAHDRTTGMPLPDHISAHHEDLELLLNGLIETAQLLQDSDYDPVISAALIAFGFVFIHPFEDGNGRIHRYLFHHMLAEKGFVARGLVFPVSAVILERIDEYRKTLEHYSKKRIGLIEWRPTAQNNVEVLNDTRDYYRFFDATKQAEFFFLCVEETVNHVLPDEVNFLARYDQLNEFIKNYIDMPDKTVDLLIRLLNQNEGKLSKRKREKEFAALTDQEVRAIEQKYEEYFQA